MPKRRQASPGYGGRSRLPARLRRERLMEAVRTLGFVSVTRIAAELAVSAMTIRRDLVELERDGQIVRSHGGALAPDEASADREETAYDGRLRRNLPAKTAIARVALGLVAEARTIALDVGTTTYQVAAQLAHRRGVKLFTNSLRIAALLAEAKQDVYVPAGAIRSDEMSICGPDALSCFQRLWFDIAFIGVSGVNKSGLFDYSIEDSEMKRALIRRSARCVVVCDGAKFDRRSLVRIAEWTDIHAIVTDKPPSAPIAGALNEARVKLLLPTEGLAGPN